MPPLYAIYLDIRLAMKRLIISVSLTLSMLFSKAQITTIGLLESHRWLTSSATSEKPIDLNNKGKSSTDLLSQSPWCIMDDILLFKDKGIFVRDDNENTCSSLPKTKGTWKLIGKDTVAIKFDNKSQFINFRILKLDQHGLALMANMPFIPGGVNVTYIFISI